jgi:hypothetical protein
VRNNQEITNRAEDINKKIVSLEKLAKETKKQSTDKEYFNKLQKRKNLVYYILALKENKGIDPDNFDPNDLKDLEEPQNYEIDQLKLNQRFWKNVGKYYNKNFEMGMDWNTKVQKLEMEIEKINRVLEEIEEKEQEEEREREMEAQRKLVEDREKDYEYAHQYQEESKYSEPDVNEDIEISVHKYGQEEFEWKENEEKLKADKLERENAELEQSIKQLEDQKRRIEVKLIRKN